MPFSSKKINHIDRNSVVAQMLGQRWGQQMQNFVAILISLVEFTRARSASRRLAALIVEITSLGDWGSGVQISPLRPIKSNGYAAGEQF